MPAATPLWGRREKRQRAGAVQDAFVPEVAAKLKEPNTKEQKFEDVVKSAEQAAVLVLVY